MKPGSHSLGEVPTTPQSEAAEWFARLQAGRMAGGETQAFDDWLQRDPSNREAFEQVAGIWSGLEPTRCDPVVLAMRERARRSARRRTAVTAGKWAAMVGVFALALVALRPSDSAAVYATAVGQTSTVTLADGSVVVLDTDSVVRHHSRVKSERRLELVRGRASFNVASDPDRPFIVRSGTAAVTAVGTEFQVRLHPAGVKVVLIEGAVRVEPNTQVRNARQIALAPGEQFVSTGGAAWQVSQVDTSLMTSWLTGNLVFDEQPLVEVVDELNRYSQVKITIADPEIRQRRLSAVLRAGDTPAFLKSIETLGVAHPRQIQADEIRLFAR